MSILGFELMGNPSGYFLNFEDKEQAVRWRNLITLLARRYIGKFQKNKPNQTKTKQKQTSKSYYLFCCDPF